MVSQSQADSIRSQLKAADKGLNTVKVLVIESGPFDQDEYYILTPGAFFTTFPANYMWLPLPSTPQAALQNKVFNVPAGKVVGGGSVVNAMVFVRPSKEELKDWDTLGAKGWDWNSLLPYYKKVSRNKITKCDGNLLTLKFSYRVRTTLRLTRHMLRRPTSATMPRFTAVMGRCKLLTPIFPIQVPVMKPLLFYKIRHPFSNVLQVSGSKPPSTRASVRSQIQMPEAARVLSQPPTSRAQRQELATMHGSTITPESSHGPIITFSTAIPCPELFSTRIKRLLASSTCLPPVAPHSR